MESTILVVGSINMDLVVRCPHIPAPGETILGSSLVETPGGKGANQAVAAGRLGGNVAMLGCLGTDGYGRALRASLAGAAVDAAPVLERGSRSGVALIEVGEAGENSIVVVPGANALLTAEDVEAALATAPAAVLLQLEIPLPTVRAAARLAQQRGITVLLDPAPAQPLPDDLLADVDILLPNQGEAALLARGPRTVIVKLGAGGALIIDPEGVWHLPGLRVETIDTTAAGDCLAGALAVALVERQPLEAALRFANAAAALSTTRRGAQDSMPDRAAVETLLAAQGAPAPPDDR